MALTPVPRRPAAAARRRPGVTLDQLHAFAAVAEGEHVTAAADALDLSQGSVSAALRRLETALGVPLFHRIGRRVRLTDAGRDINHLAIRTLAAAAEIERIAGGYRALEGGAVEIAAGRVMGAHRLSRWLAGFVDDHPAVDVRIHLAAADAVKTMLQDGSADVVILGSDLDMPGIETFALEQTELVVVAGAQHRLARSRAPMRELSSHRYLAHERGTATQELAERVLGSRGATSATVELEEGALLAALLAGIGFAVMPRAVIESEIASGRIVVLGGRDRPVVQQFSAARRLAVHTPAVDAFWAHLRRLGTTPPGPR